ncbi:uncharacterized protein CC84DRAFT_1258265 [Paraphaeosphaeria sporulosa]|uniref:HSF-type DNA-binding domain-containing protein n=1 Tax=Paraphaeosphaeria sporulosa TaxID=1460663 RepID=A0A177CJV0_9PLEO|nr:uncharacterized protein CC84DRAFT_1258265 [Paraphaeosphaeria sporulosa]OAG07067.1 hypothetical protein CC84DRAFT_1258265 [Paraphaeosphaeria sporulosa]
MKYIQKTREARKAFQSISLDHSTAPKPTHEHKLHTHPLFKRNTSRPPAPTPDLLTRSSTLSLRGKRRDHGPKAVVDKSPLGDRQKPYLMELLPDISERKATNTDGIPQRPTSVESVFFRSLYNMLEDQSIQHLISWSSTNDAFVLSPSSEFAKALLSHFHHTSISSFIRQLNMYGFHKRDGPGAALAAIESQQCKEDDLREVDPETLQSRREVSSPEEYALPNLGSLIAGWQATLPHNQAERDSGFHEGDMVDVPQSWTRGIEGDDIDSTDDLHSARSSGSSPIGNPKLPATVENAIQRLILPELIVLNDEQRIHGDHSVIDNTEENVVESRQTAMGAQPIVDHDQLRQNSNTRNSQNHRTEVPSGSASILNGIYERALVGKATSSESSKVGAVANSGNSSPPQSHPSPLRHLRQSPFRFDQILRSFSAHNANGSRESLLSSHDESECASDTSSASHRDVDIHNALDSAMSVVKGVMLQKLVGQALSEATEMSGASNRASGDANAFESFQPSRSTTTNNGGKRARGGGRDPDDEGDDDSDQEDDNRPRKKGPTQRIPQRRLKCPFYLRQPEKYTKAACRGEGFAEMGKLKDHLKRVHMHPLRCHRCHEEMSEEELEAHMIMDNACAIRPAPQDDRIAPQKLWRLDFKRAPFVNARSTEEKWKMLYKMLFPADAEETIPSPYTRNALSPDLARALSEALEEELNKELALFMEPVISRIKERIPAIIERCRTTLATRAINTIEETNAKTPLPETSQSPLVTNQSGRLREKLNSSAQILNDGSRLYSQPRLRVRAVRRRQPQYSPVPQMTPSRSSEGSEETSTVSASASTDNIAHMNTLRSIQYPESSANITGVGDWNTYDSISAPMQPGPDTTILGFGVPPLYPPCQGVEEQNPASRPYHNNPYLYGGAAFGDNGVQDWSTMANMDRKSLQAYPPAPEQLLNEDYLSMQCTHWQVPPHDHLP